jgi:hypothetical protein
MTDDVKVGDRIRLIEMPDDPCPVPPGTEGEVTGINNDMGGGSQISVKWDNGRTLSMITPPDTFVVLQETK